MKIVNGDLVNLFKKGSFDAIAHGCNCFHAMNSGIAKTIREEFDEAYRADILTRFGDYWKLGNFSDADVVCGTIYNLYTQNRPGKQTDLQELYTNIECAFTNLNLRVRDIRLKNNDKPYNLGIPKIGAGIAGGDWKTIEKIIAKATPDIHITVVNFVPEHVDLFEL